MSKSQEIHNYTQKKKLTVRTRPNFNYWRERMSCERLSCEHLLCERLVHVTESLTSLSPDSITSLINFVYFALKINVFIHSFS